MKQIDNPDHYGPLGKFLGCEGDKELDFTLKFINFPGNKKFEIEDWVFMEPIAEGNTGVTRKVYHKETLKTFALRTINTEKLNNELSDIRLELKILKMFTEFPHKNILKLVCSRMMVSSQTLPNRIGSSDYEFFAENKEKDDSMSLNIIVVTELCIGSLKDIARLKKKNKDPWTEPELFMLLKDMAEALAHAENLGISHRNLKPSNILISEDKLTYKLVDFKSSLILEVGKKIIKANIVGTPRYMSPEMKLLYNELKSKSSLKTTLTYDPYLSDVFSLGLIILELMMDFVQLDKDIKLEAETSQKILRRVSSTYPNMAKVLNKMLSNDYRSRPRFNQIPVLCDMVDGNLSKDVKEEVLRKRYKTVRLLEREKCEQILHENPSKLVEISRAYIRLFAMEENIRKEKEKAISFKFFAEGGLMDAAKLDNPHEEKVLRFLHLSQLHLIESKQYKEAIDINIILRDIIFKKHHTDIKPKMCAVFNSFGRIYQMMRLGAESKRFYQRALEIVKEACGEGSLIEAKILNNYGGLLLQEGEFFSTGETFQEAIKIKSNQLPENHISIGVSYHNLANTQVIMGEYNDSKHNFQRALASYMKHCGENSIYTARALSGIGVLFYSHLNDPQRGKDCILKALSIYKNNPDRIDEWHLIMSYYHISNCHKKLENLDQALNYLKKAIQLGERAEFEDKLCIKQITKLKHELTELFQQRLSQEAQSEKKKIKVEGEDIDNLDSDEN